MPQPSSSRKTISSEQWEAKLGAVKVAKEDMNRLIMNFLVTEVRNMQLGSACVAAQHICEHSMSLTLGITLLSVCMDHCM